jgi:hypothetical protein
MHSNIDKINETIAPLKSAIINHPVYEKIKDIEDLKIFMKYHVFAVWDFMSLLKSLQINLTCTSTPWFPKGKANTRFLINEIVVGEESDVDPDGGRISHFELYLKAMKQCGSSTEAIEKFIANLQETQSLEKAYQTSETPAEVQHFVNYTFEIINSNKAHLQAAVFTFGREDLIPSMFISLLNEMQNPEPERTNLFKYYLERHIEIDGDHHSHLALEMTAELCETNHQFWEEAEIAIINSLKARIELWNGAHHEITLRQAQ